MNYWVMLSGSPAELVAMATHSGYGALWVVVQRIAEKHHDKQQCVFRPKLSIFGRHFVQMCVFTPAPALPLHLQRS